MFPTEELYEQLQGETMLLQGNLQNVFDALYTLGVIDPVLEMDWAEAINNLSQNVVQIDKVIAVVNRNQGNVNSLVSELKNFDEKSLSYLAMEVAREFADYHTRENIH